MDLLPQTPEILLEGFLFPWGLLIGALGFLAAWCCVIGMEHLRWTRRVWNLPVFFVALAVLLSCIFGILLAP
jgi:hypothetical protein